MRNIDKSGIYAITHAATGRVYVGSALKFSRRWAVHRHGLKAGNHRSKRLQAAWDEFAADAFTFSILEFVDDPANIIAREQHWLDHFDASCPSRGFNACPVAESRLGMKMPESAKAAIGRASRGRKLTPEQKARISAVHKGKTISEAHRAAVSAALKGRKFTIEHAAKIGAANRGRAVSEHAKQRASEVHKGKKLTEAQKSAVGAAAKARIRKPEERAKVSAAKKAYWAAWRQARSLRAS